MSAPARVHKSRLYTASPTWIANCRRCWWYGSYPSWHVAVDASLQHIRHWAMKEQGHDAHQEVPF